MEADRIPRHVAIIMDGNGRWAKARHLPRVAGHKAGMTALHEAVRVASELGIRFLTLYAFSSENWSRPESEVSDLLGLLTFFMKRDLNDLHNSNVRVKIIGRRDDLKPDILKLLHHAEQLTENNDGMTLVIAFNYGSRDEMMRACQSVVNDVVAGRMSSDQITQDLLSERLDTATIPDPDLIIRTSGEVRLSNFLLWQAAYAELVFLPCFWPDFDRKQFMIALEDYQQRDRRFGKVKST
jgi:undecaprenyl diphosphate synthase